LKPIEFLGDALSRLRAFPKAARRAAGYQIDRVQRGLEPDDWKPMTTIGPGVREIRTRAANGAFRVLYLATLPDRVVILHAFQEKARKTARANIELARRRLADLHKG
jgi:phage-related protein